MPINVYDASVPVYTQMLTALSGLLDKAAAFAAAKKVDPSVLLGARLYPDMFPFSRQIQIAADNAKAPAARLAGVPVPRFEDTEKTVDELKARIAKTIEFLASIDRAKFDGAEDRNITWPSGGRERTLVGKAYLFTHALPNFFFHATTAYAILRHNGVDLGKSDYLIPQSG